MLPFRRVTASLALLLAILMAACGPGTKPDESSPVTPEETVTPETGMPTQETPLVATPTPTPAPIPAASPAPPPATKEESIRGSFLHLLPPHVIPPREVEKPVFRIYYDLESIPDVWIDEWKAGRDLKVEQRLLPTDPAQWPKDADLVIAPPDRLVYKNLRPYPADAPPARANPVFLHHPFDPDQTMTRPWRWTPWVLMRHAPAGAQKSPAPASTEPAMPDRPEVARGWWLKSQHLSANHPMNTTLAAKWQAHLAGITPAMEPVAALWSHLLEGKTPAALLPLSFKLRQNDAPADWTAPATGTLIHIDLLAVGLDSDQPELALEWSAFLSDAQRQKALVETTGYYPVQRPLGREIPDLPGAPPPWWERSEFLVGTPPPPKTPPRPVVIDRPAPTPDRPAAVPPENPGEIKPAVPPSGSAR